MNREQIAKLIEAAANKDDDLFAESVRALTVEKFRQSMGYETLTEVGDVKITNNDVFVAGKKVGSINLDDDSAVVEFTDNDGDVKSFDDTEALHRFLNTINESDHSKRVVKKTNAGDGPQGEYDKKDPRSNEHKDPRMENPKKHDHGLDGEQEGIVGQGDGPHPEDKKHTLKDRLHKDNRMENPKKHDHGNDDKSGVDDKGTKGGAAGAPEDKQHNLKDKLHKDERMENPKKNDHGHDDPSGTGKAKK